MKLHILGIAGTFMGGVAALARELGHAVDGSDANIYPPMSTQLERLGIALNQGYAPEHIAPDTGMVVIGNALSRGNAAVEHVLNSGMAYTSGAEWLREQVLPGRTTLAVAGTHGKTTTTSILAYILDVAGRDPGFLVGGVAEDFGVSARLGKRGQSEFCSPAASHVDGSVQAKLHSDPFPFPFVVEADEYDTAFFDKRSKFVHYRPHVAILNNLEYDHADIFPDIAAIQRQFHHLVRTVPGNGRLIVNGNDARLAEVLAMGCWTPVERFGLQDGYVLSEFEWSAQLSHEDGSQFAVIHHGSELGVVRWNLLGRHNVLNALAALAAAHAVGVDVAAVLPKLAAFRGVKRRLEVIGNARGVTIYDDFAHHPTAIHNTLAGLRARVGATRLIVAMEPRSNSMRLGAHAAELAPSLAAADVVVFLQHPDLKWDAQAVLGELHGEGFTANTVDALIAKLVTLLRDGDAVVFMSNGGFEDAPRRLLVALQDI